MHPVLDHQIRPSATLCAVLPESNAEFLTMAKIDIVASVRCQTSYIIPISDSLLLQKQGQNLEKKQNLLFIQRIAGIINVTKEKTHQHHRQVRVILRVFSKGKTNVFELPV